MSGAVDRRGAAARPLVVLLVLAAVAVAAVWWFGRERTPDYTLGGPLFPVPAERIEGLLLTRQGQQYRFDRRTDGGWSLSGAVSDYLNDRAMDALVGMLPTAMGGALLPGTEPEDRRYDFNGPEAIRLRIFLAGGGNLSLALGATNPVTGNVFGSGAGRAGCFPVPGALRDKLNMLPRSVQATTLLPKFSRDRVQTVTVIRSGTPYDFARRDGRWWLRLDRDDQTLPPSVRAYNAVYDDRLREAADGRWLMASEQAVGQLIYEVSETVVREILGPREGAGRLADWELDPPWRTVVLAGAGLNPDPTAPARDQFTIAFGPPIETDRVPALRRGNVLVTDHVAINLLDKGLGDLMEQGALNETARHADRVRVQREGRLLLDAGRTGSADTDEGRTAWRTVIPAAGREGFGETERHGLAQDLVVDLNRMGILAVLPPSDDGSVLADGERVRVTLTWGTGADTRDLVLESGYLQTDRLPAGAGLARDPDGGPPVGLWFPATGKLLQVSSYLVVNARNMAPLVRPVIPD